MVVVVMLVMVMVIVMLLTTYLGIAIELVSLCDEASSLTHSLRHVILHLCAANKMLIN